MSCFFRPSLHGHYPASSLLRHLLTPPPLSRRRSPQVRCRIFPFAPTGSTRCVSDDFRALLFPASLPPAPGLTAGSCSYGRRFATRFLQWLHLAFRYGCRHRLRLAPFIQRDSAHAGHTGAGALARGRRPRRPARLVTLSLGVPKIKRARSNPLGVGPRLK